jgi:hypothetical protein
MWQSPFLVVWENSPARPEVHMVGPFQERQIVAANLAVALRVMPDEA